MSIWILGSGTFGLRAAGRLALKFDPGSITIVDPSARALVGADLPAQNKICADGVDFLAENLFPGKAPDWIIPALPVHLVWEWAARVMGPGPLGPGRLKRAALPGALTAALPNAMTGASGDLYVSHADFLCPPNCSEPDGFCTHTGQPRKEDMFRLLEGKGTEALPALVIRSRQLGPGIGGFAPMALFDLMARLEEIQGPCFVATACRCHGVVTGGIRQTP